MKHYSRDWNFVNLQKKVMWLNYHSWSRKVTRYSDERDSYCVNYQDSVHEMCLHSSGANSNREEMGLRRSPHRGCARLVTEVRLMMVGIFLCLWSFPDVVLGQYSIDTSGDNNTSSLVVNITTLPTTQACPQRDCDDGGKIAAAVIISLLIGILVGAIVTYFVLQHIGKKKTFVPPKDYDLADTDQFDVNRNNDDTTLNTDTEVTSDQPGVKGHKKLERLVKPTQAPEGDITIPTAATPLIVNKDAPKSNATAPTPTNSDADNDQQDNNGNAGGLYLNVGDEGRLSQPYESLDIIPEDVEYENTPASTYERLSPETPKKL